MYDDVYDQCDVYDDIYDVYDDDDVNLTDQLCLVSMFVCLSIHLFVCFLISAGKKAFVYYFHSKGSCCSRSHSNHPDKIPQNEGVVAWREYMNAVNLEFPSICLRALLNGYTTCGAENQDRHYAGEREYLQPIATSMSMSMSMSMSASVSVDEYLYQYAHYLCI